MDPACSPTRSWHINMNIMCHNPYTSTSIITTIVIISLANLRPLNSILVVSELSFHLTSEQSCESNCLKKRLLAPYSCYPPFIFLLTSCRSSSYYLLVFFFPAGASRASALYRTRCGYRRTMTFTRPPGTEWRSPRRITRTNGKGRSLKERDIQPFEPPSSFQRPFQGPRSRFLLSQDFPSRDVHSTVNNPRVVASLLQTFARRYSLLTDVRTIHGGI